ncbi:MAG TPA: lysophospholipid acyltransferase family protein [Pseudomonadaceae bacterium]|nr:lysophospholipid acyltransferase family protein [Pseudomonadaceae bacterium]
MKYRFIIAFFHLMARLPLRLSRALGRLLGSLAWVFGSRMRKVTLTNIALCFPELDLQAQRSLARESLRHTFMTLTETGAVWLWPGARSLGLIQEVEGKGLLEEAKAQGKGVIVLAPHLGNWEMVGLYLNACGLGPSFQLYQAPADAQLAALILKARSRLGATMVATDNKGVAELLRALRTGHIAGILPDQVPGEAGGQHAPFFAQPALTMTLLNRLQQKTGAIVVAAFAERIAGGFKLHLQAPDAGIYAADMEEALAGLNRSVEQLVRLAPVQYQWEYKRFRRPPAGQPSVY